MSVRGFFAAMAGIGVACAVSPAPTFAADDDGAALLRKVASAGHQLTYSGVFTYRSGTREETSRIAHSVESGRQRERIEVLDGSPREVVRDGQEVKCFLPEEKLLIVENQSRHRGFPAVLPPGGVELEGNYLIRRSQAGRVAGIEARAILLEPRDAYRYGHELWIDPVSGLLLKASLLGEKGEPLETFAFTQLNIGGPLERNALIPKFEQDRVRVRKVASSDIRADDMAWVFRNSVPGFRQMNAMRRSSATAGQESVHVVFSDGLASISVFLESAVAGVEDGTARVGAINVYRRRIDEFQAVVMGEVPAVAVRRLGEGIERRVR